MNVNDLIAIDVHTHAEVSCRHPADEYGKIDVAADKYFKTSHRPTIAEPSPTTVNARSASSCLRRRGAEMGRRRIPNEEIAKPRAENSDIMMPSPASIRTKASWACAKCGA